MLKTQYEFWVSATKTVNALRIITNHKKPPAVPPAQKLNQFKLAAFMS